MRDASGKRLLAASEEKAEAAAASARAAERHMDASRREVEQCRAEAEALQKLVKSLQQKIKELGRASAGVGGGAEANFSDTFEEVMQEEMAAMKGAFEAKLRSKQGQIEDLQKSHNLELRRARESTEATSRRGGGGGGGAGAPSPLAHAKSFGGRYF